MSDLIPVLVEIKGTAVSVQECVRTPLGVALNPRGAFSPLGTVMEAKVPGKAGREVKAWRWASEGYTGDESSKAKAVAAMLADAGYEQVALTATIPDLLAGLEATS